MSILTTVKEAIKSGEYCRCGYCRHEGYAYGAVHFGGVSVPWCKQCGKNDKLKVVRESSKVKLNECTRQA